LAARAVNGSFVTFYWSIVTDTSVVSLFTDTFTAEKTSNQGTTNPFLHIYTLRAICYSVRPPLRQNPKLSRVVSPARE